MAQLSLSFNSMTESIEKLILEQKEKQRLEGELAIAQEVQAQLFPRQVTELESLEVHGFCRPARTVSGDYYDFLTASSHKLILAVGDISGKGISAALLMATIHSAVRAYSVESLPQMREPVAVGAVAGAGRMMAAWPEGIEISPGALLGLLNHQLYESTPPEKYATLFLGIYDGRSHRLTYSNGGHLPPILIGKDGAVRRLEAGGTVVGLFDNMTYDEGCGGNASRRNLSGLQRRRHRAGKRVRRIRRGTADRSGEREPASAAGADQPDGHVWPSMTGSATTSSRMTSRWCWRGRGKQVLSTQYPVPSTQYPVPSTQYRSTQYDLAGGGRASPSSFVTRADSNFFDAAEF